MASLEPTTAMPTTWGPDSTPALLIDGYEFIRKRCDRFGSDVFATRLRGQATICLRGEPAARLFYDEGRFLRAGAAPSRVSKTLFGSGGIQSLDGEEHRARKALFLSRMSPDAIDRLVEVVDLEWTDATRRWSRQPCVVLFDEITELLTRSSCAWSGIPLRDDEVASRTADLAAMIDAAGSIGPRYLRGRVGRIRGDRWAAGVIRRFRAGRLDAAEDSAVASIASYRDSDGKHLDTHSAAVELLNVIRPTVAVARYVVFIAMALHRHPTSLAHLRNRPDDDEYLEWFVQEVRRAYPFFPFVAAKVRSDFAWRGYRFPEGTRVLLDLYATDHDERLWSFPDRFDPERFAEWDGGAYDLIPQGGGDHAVHHRCPGEWVTIALMRHAARFLASRLRYEVPAQDLTLSLSRLPALPRSRFVLTDVRPA